MTSEPLVDDRTRRIITRVFRLLEDVIFVGLGMLLAGCAIYLLVAAVGSFAEHIYRMNLNGAVKKPWRGHETVCFGWPQIMGNTERPVATKVIVSSEQNATKTIT